MRSNPLIILFHRLPFLLITAVLTTSSLSAKEPDAAEELMGARAVATHINHNALLANSIRNIGINVDSPETVRHFIESFKQQLPEGYRLSLNYVGPGPTPPAVIQLFAELAGDSIPTSFYELDTQDLRQQFETQNAALDDPSNDAVLEAIDPSVDPDMARAVSKEENRKIYEFFQRWKEQSAKFVSATQQWLGRRPKQALDSPVEPGTPPSALDHAGQALGIAKVGGLVSLWFFSGDTSSQMDMQTLAIAALASGSGAWLMWAFTRYATEWLDYRRNFKIVRTKVKIQWFNIFSWLKGGVAVGSNAFLKVPGGERVARWFNQQLLVKYLVLDAGVRAGLGSYFRLLAYLKDKSGGTAPPWSAEFWGDMVKGHQDIIYSSAAEAKLQQLYERGVLSDKVRWVGAQTWGMCLYAIQMVTDFGFQSFFIGRAVRGTALAIMVPSKLMTVAAGAIFDQPVSERGKTFSNIVPDVEPNEIRVSVLSGRYNERDVVSLSVLNQMDGAIETNDKHGGLDVAALDEIISSIHAEPIKLSTLQRVARAVQSWSNRWVASPLRKVVYGRCGLAFMPGAEAK